MTYKFHKSSYNLGDRLLNTDERVIVSTREGPEEVQAIAIYMGLSDGHPELMLDHYTWGDGEYLPTFLTKNCLNPEEFPEFKTRYEHNYVDSAGNRKFGEGLKGKVVYIAHTLSRSLTPQNLNKRIEMIADTAKYNGAEAVVLLAYTLNYSAQERGVHDTDHERMKKYKDKLKFDGQAPSARLQLMQFLTSGVDAVITPHNHSPVDMKRLCNEVNDEYRLMHEQAMKMGITKRYHLDFVHVDLAPMLGHYVQDLSEEYLDFDISDKGRNIIFIAPDKGIFDFVKSVKKHSGLKNAAIAAMDKIRLKDGSGIEELILDKITGIDPARGIEGMQALVIDDAIRSGETMKVNIDVLMGKSNKTVRKSGKIKGTPSKVVTYASRTDFQTSAVKTLRGGRIEDIIVTNADARGPKNLGPLRSKTQILWINHLLAEAGFCVEQGLDVDSVLTTNYIRDHNLIWVDLPQSHKKRRTFLDNKIK